MLKFPDRIGAEAKDELESVSLAVWERKLIIDGVILPCNLPYRPGSGGTFLFREIPQNFGSSSSTCSTTCVSLRAIQVPHLICAGSCDGWYSVYIFRMIFVLRFSRQWYYFKCFNPPLIYRFNL